MATSRMYPIEPDPKKKKKKIQPVVVTKKIIPRTKSVPVVQKKSGAQMQENLINYTSKRGGAIGDVARIVKKRNEALKNIMAEDN